MMAKKKKESENQKEDLMEGDASSESHSEPAESSSDSEKELQNHPKFSKFKEGKLNANK